MLLGLAFFWYGLVPIVGAFLVRKTWRVFRKRFDELRAAPLLDYRAAESLGDQAQDYRFFGGFESASEHTIWVRNEDLTIPVELRHTKVFILPAVGDDGEDEAEGEPRRAAWHDVAALSEGARIFVGGSVCKKDGRIRFAPCRTAPLVVILYDGDERSLLFRVVRAGRHRNEYWNPLTSYSLAAGVFSQLLMALNFANRPAFVAAFAAALTGALGPVIPLLPPGVLPIAAYRLLWHRARSYRALRDVVRLPLRHTGPENADALLVDGTRYGARRCADIPEADGDPPYIPLEIPLRATRGWLVYGRLDGDVPLAPKDPSAAFMALPDEPVTLARSLSAQARWLEALSAAALLAGLAANAVIVYFLIGTALDLR